MSSLPVGTDYVEDPHRAAANKNKSLFPTASARDAEDDPLAPAIARTRHYLLDAQHDDGYWVGELEGDSILESEYILLLAFLGRHHEDVARKAASYLLDQQGPDGGWSIYPGGPVDVSASVKAYLALKVTGEAPEAPAMQRARRAIREAGGVDAVNSFTRFYLAMLGQIPYSACPAVPPEMILVPSRVPFNLYEMSAWTRTIVVPLSVIYAFRPVRRLGPEEGLEELYEGDGPPRSPAPVPQGRWLTWENFFYRVSEWAKRLDGWGLTPMRRRAVKVAERWMAQRFEESDGLGAIFPPIIWSVVALRCLGYAEDHPWVTSAMYELDRLMIEEAGRVRLQPCVSPIWDTALCMLALRDAGVSAEAEELDRGARWLISKQVRQKGDWAVHRPALPPGGWYFEFRNEFYPDVDDTAMVLMALARCGPDGASHKDNGRSLRVDAAPCRAVSRDATVLGAQTNGDHSQAAALLRYGSPASRANGSAGNGRVATALRAVWRGTASNGAGALRRIEPLVTWTSAVDRGLRWVLGLQNTDGGWAAFDVDNDRELLTLVPFADHNAMLDPSTADITGRVLEMLGIFGFQVGHSTVDRAVSFLWRQQEPDGSWYGRWGVNYVYGTWQSLVGLRSVGVPSQHPRIRRAVEWLLACQQADGAWGESCRSYEDVRWKGRGEATPSQTAWALMGLMAAGEEHSPAVRRGIDYLLCTQYSDGTWDEPYFTGTGFPRVFYLKYHFYRLYFPLMALARYGRMTGRIQA